MLIYGDKIKNNEITVYDYFIKRFARLYPLHIITLLAVLFLIILLNEFTDYNYFIYPYNDVKHFFLNLFFASHWGLEDGHSFNAPIWSVSNEVLLYGMFFTFLFYFRKCKQIFIYASIVIFMILTSKFNIPNFSLLVIKKSTFMFFFGCLLFELLYKSTVKKATISVIVLCFTYAFVSHANVLVERAGLPFGLELIIFISFLLLFERFNLAERLMKNRVSILQYLGNLTYSTYLIHFPIQILFVLIFEKIYPINFNSKFVFYSYIITVFILGRLTYVYIELPMKKKILNAYYSS
ncbi:acyltransferase [Vibrio coralliilyticus]|uniref:acyltransferase family protein n=1 Tax=Vibrio TaxID=662 RepID=UPI000507301D|nr:hypothetical protein IX95_15985 [Vibrio sp. B183]NOI18057.1 acyltransferase [Vibrio coralliilyticus]